jgi:hypothetical protein
MPTSYVASLRLAQAELDAGREDDALAACERGLPNATGPGARAWLLRIEADALVKLGRRADALNKLADARVAAQQIGNATSRANTLAAIQAAEAAAAKP